MLRDPKNSEPSYREMRAMLLKPNPSIAAIDCSENRMALQGLVIGLISGIVIRIAWELGLISYAMVPLNDAAAAMWIMLCDLCDACSELLKVLLAS